MQSCNQAKWKCSGGDCGAPISGNTFKQENAPQFIPELRFTGILVVSLISVQSSRIVKKEFEIARKSSLGVASREGYWKRM
jgi:hypothetical protein